MTYLLFVNGTFFASTRNNAEAFQWYQDWEELGHSPGLKFVSDDDEEALLWLVPEDAQRRIAA